MPVIGALLCKVTISRFARLLSSLIRSGIPITRSLEVVAETLNNLVMVRIIENVRAAVSEGKRLSEPFSLSGFFPTMVVQMISAGEETGKLDETLKDVSAFYDTEVDYAIKNFTAILEPVMLLGMGGMVGFVALSVLLPIFNLVKLFRQF